MDGLKLEYPKISEITLFMPAPTRPHEKTAVLQKSTAVM